VILYPAIDLYQQKVVRLDKGDYDKMTEYDSRDPLEWGKYLRDCGAGWLHVIDLEGAKTGKPLHLNVLRKLAGLGLRVQYGGGLRDTGSIQNALEAGASRVLVGSLLVEDKNMPSELFTLYGNMVAPAVDTRRGYIAVKGWTSLSDLDAVKFTRHLSAEGFDTFLFTCIERDGTLQGPDIPLYAKLRSEFPGIQILAAGGISSIEDLLELKQAGVDGAVLGKSIYERRIDLKEALEVTEKC